MERGIQNTIEFKNKMQMNYMKLLIINLITIIGVYTYIKSVLITTLDFEKVQAATKVRDLILTV